MMLKTAVLMTCHNRCDLTLRCLKSLFNQDRFNKFNVEVFLVDAESSDGTKDSVRKSFPTVRIILGSGNLFWCSGMRLAWQEALQEEFDYFLWLNDDVELMPTALSDLFLAYDQVRQEYGEKVLVSGSMFDPITKKRSYGGALSKTGEQSIVPADSPKEAHIIAGNLLLVPKIVVDTIGILDKRFTHGMGDYDYALRARKKGVRIFTAANYQGACHANIGVAWHDPKKSLRERWAILHSPKGPPPSEYFFFIWRHKPLKAPFSIAKMYMRVFFPSLFLKSRI